LARASDENYAHMQRLDVERALRGQLQDLENIRPLGNKVLDELTALRDAPVD